MSKALDVRINKSQYSREELAEKVYRLFRDNGYRLAHGSKTDGLYAKGWAVFRMFFGGFARRYRFSIHITEGSVIWMEQYLPAKPTQGIPVSAGAYGIPGGGTIIHGAFGMSMDGGMRGVKLFNKEFYMMAEKLRGI